MKSFDSRERAIQPEQTGTAHHLLMIVNGFSDKFSNLQIFFRVDINGLKLADNMNVGLAADSAAVAHQGLLSNAIQSSGLLDHGMHILAARQDTGSIIDGLAKQPVEAVICSGGKAGIIFGSVHQLIEALLNGGGLQERCGGKQLEIVVIARIVIQMVDQQIVTICSVQSKLRLSHDGDAAHLLCVFSDFVAIGVNVHIIEDIGLQNMLDNILVQLLSVENTEVLPRNRSEFALMGIKHAVFIIFPPDYRLNKVSKSTRSNTSNLPPRVEL